MKTDSINYQTAIKKLFESEFDADCLPLWNYREVSSNPIEGHSFTFLAKDGLGSRKLIYRKYYLLYQTDNKDHEVFNLDNIQIVEEELSISLNELFEIQHLLNSELEVNKHGSINSNDSSFELTDFKKNLT